MVIVSAVVGTDGSVLETNVLRSVPLLDQAAMDALRQWRFQPMKQDGVPVKARITVTMNFRL